MGRKLLMVLLGLGAVAGFTAGFARLCHGGYGGWAHHGPGSRFERHAAFEQHIADTCTQAAKRVYDGQSRKGSAP